MSSEAGAVSPPTVKIGSSTVTVELLTVTVVPLTVRSPVTVRLFPTVTSLGKPIVIVSPETEVSISSAVPEIVKVSEPRTTPSIVTGKQSNSYRRPYC